MWYDVAPDEAVHDILIELDDIAVAVTPVGIAGGDSVVGDGVVAEADGLDIADVLTLFVALNS
jgi:hypothetical protein